MSEESLTLKHMTIIGKFSDGNCRQIVIKPETENLVLSAIIHSEGKINVVETILENIDIETNE